jgi:hypothetical protein
MLYSILIYGTDADIANLSKAEEERLIGQHIVVQGKLAAERKLGPVVRLHPSTTAMTLRKGPEAYIIDGPFAETKELIAGYWVWRVASMDEAVSWLKKAPFDGGAELEIRPIFEAEDFGKEYTPELRAQEERLRAQIAERK